MIFNKYLFFFVIVIFLETLSTFPHYYHRLRRQINFPNNVRPPYAGRPKQMADTSGSIVGTYYYGVGADPNYGSSINLPNSANGNNVLPISYNPDSSLFSSLIDPNYQNQPQPQQSQSQQYYMYNNNNAWQRPSSNGYPNQPYNRYPPGSQGWYATGGNYWYNNGQLIIAHPYLLMINILLLVICK